MANNQGSPAWRIDTAGVLTTEFVTISEVRFMPSDSGDDVVIKTASGGYIWEWQNALAATPIGDAEKIWSAGLKVKGINVSTLSAGAVLYIYLK